MEGSFVSVPFMTINFFRGIALRVSHVMRMCGACANGRRGRLCVRVRSYWLCLPPTNGE
jgi:hypothetical protein